MSFGSSIIAVDLAPMPEFCADSAIFYKHGDYLMLSSRVHSFISNKYLRFHYSQLSLARSNIYSWDNFFLKLSRLV